MKQLTSRFSIKAFFATLVLGLFTLISQAQDNSTVKVNGEELGSWLSRNWMWVAGGTILLLLLIGVFSNNRRSRTPITKKTTIVREEDANGVVRTTTTEIKE